MLTGITYNCDTESLGDVDRAAFVEAFENEVRAVSRFRDLSVSVTFESGRSEVTQFASDDWEADISHEDEYRDRFDDLAQKAFASCLV
jgi:hypothetical protein